MEWDLCMRYGMFYFCNTWRRPMGSRSYGTPKLCFESHMIRIKLFDQASLILWGAQTVVGNVLHPVHEMCLFCVSIIFFSFFCFSLLLTQNHWKKRTAFQTKKRLLFSEWCISKIFVDMLNITLQANLPIVCEIVYRQNAVLFKLKL